MNEKVEEPKTEEKPTNIPSWWHDVYINKYVNPRKRGPSRKREIGYYVVINGETKAEVAPDGKVTKRAQKFCQRVERFEFPVPTKRQTKKYDATHIWPEKYKAKKAEEEKKALAEKVLREKLAEKAKKAEKTLDKK